MERPGELAVYHDLSMVMTKPGDSYFLSWNFDDQTPATIAGSDLGFAVHRTATASQNGRIFLTKNTKTWTIVNKKVKQLKDFPVDMYQGCAAFDPQDDDTVYVIGGRVGSNYIKSVYRYQFSTNEFTDLGKDVPVNGGIRRMSCVGVVSTDGDKVFIQAPIPGL